MAATHLINLLPSSVLGWKSPHELLLGTPPCYSYLKVMGCLCYIAQRLPNKKCVFIGYPIGQKGYKLYDLTSYKVVLSRDVHFVEDVFTFKDSITSPIDDLSITFSLPLVNLVVDFSVPLILESSNSISFEPSPTSLCSLRYVSHAHIYLPQFFLLLFNLL